MPRHRIAYHPFSQGHTKPRVRFIEYMNSQLQITHQFEGTFNQSKRFGSDGVYRTEDFFHPTLNCTMTKILAIPRCNYGLHIVESQLADSQLKPNGLCEFGWLWHQFFAKLVFDERCGTITSRCCSSSSSSSNGTE